MHQIGAGVLGPVFRAYNPPHDRPFAVKAFHIDITPEQAETLTERFGALVAAGAFHPAAVPATAVGVDDGVLYLAQEYVAGESLDAVMRDYAPAALERALPLIDRLAGAIDAAHALGVRHGGLHLRDIIVTPSGGRVTGFGVLAALEEVGVSGPIRRPYTAPEMIARRAWGPAADRFALGAVAYELLTGKRAAGTGAQVAARLAELDEIEDVESLQAVFETALADGPDSRYASAARFAADLHAAAGVPFDEEALELAPPPEGGADPAPAGPAKRPADREAVGEAAAPAAEILVDPLPDATEPAVEDDGPALDTEPAAGLAGAEAGGAAWEAEPDAESEPALQFEPEARVAPEVQVESGPQPDLQPGPAPEPALAFEPVPDPDLAPEPRSPAPSVLAEAALEREIAPAPDPEPAPELDLEAVREEVAAPAPPAAGLLDERDLLDRLDDPDAAHDRDWAGEAEPAAGDDVPYRPWASGSVLAIAAVLTVGAVAAYLVGLQMAGDQGLEDRRAAGPAPPATGAAGDPERDAANVAPPPRAAGPTGSAPVERAPAPEPVRAPPPAPAPPAGTAAPPPLAEASEPPRLEAGGPPPAAAPAPPAAPAPAAGWLLVRSEPPGATVTVDGVDRGRTPLALGDMPFDTYRVEVSREGFRSEAAQLALTPAATVGSIQIELQPGDDPPPAPVVGALLVESRPPGARVVIDGREVGTTPTVVSGVAAGTRGLRIELDGYQPWETSVDVPASDQVRVGASLDPLSRR